MEPAAVNFKNSRRDNDIKCPLDRIFTKSTFQKGYCIRGENERIIRADLSNQHSFPKPMTKQELIVTTVVPEVNKRVVYPLALYSPHQLLS